MIGGLLADLWPVLAGVMAAAAALFAAWRGGKIAAEDKRKAEDATAYWQTRRKADEAIEQSKAPEPDGSPPDWRQRLRNRKRPGKR